VCVTVCVCVGGGGGWDAERKEGNNSDDDGAAEAGDGRRGVRDCTTGSSRKKRGKKKDRQDRRCHFPATATAAFTTIIPRCMYGATGVAPIRPTSEGLLLGPPMNTTVLVRTHQKKDNSDTELYGYRPPLFFSSFFFFFFSSLFFCTI